MPDKINNGARPGRAMDELRLKSSLILTEDSEEEIAREGKVITVKPVYARLLREE